MSKAEVYAVRVLMDAVVSGTKTAREASDLLEINLGLIERVVERMREQREGIPARPPDDLIDYYARKMLVRVMRREW